jgi:uncharacterized membrane protein
MINRKQLKSKARISLKNNYWKMVVVCMISLFFAGTHTNISSPLNSSSSFNTNSDTIEPLYGVDNLVNYQEIITNNKIIIKSDNPIWDILDNYNPKRGALSVLYNNVISSNSLNFGVLNIIITLIKGNSFTAYIFLIIGFFISIFIQTFFKNIIQVGEIRFFLESRKYKKTKLNTMLMPYYIKKGYRSGLTLLVKSIYQFFWNLTIIGGIIKHYSYYLVPYILAENPTLKINQTINISRNMMNGNKWTVFKLELSFIGWHLLSVFSLGFLSIFFINPYVIATNTEYFVFLRQKELESGNYQDFLIDSALYNSTDDECYPSHEYPLPIRETFKINTDYNRKYKPINLLFMFFIFSFIGWAWEVSLHLMEYGLFVNRGTMFGPWLPIYGSGTILMLVLLKRFNDSIVKTFIFSMIVAGIMEYCTATFLLVRYHMKWWDYTGYFLNLNGRICLEGLIFFAIGGVIMIYIIAPVLDDLINEHYVTIKKISIILVMIFMIDYVYSTINPNTGNGVTDYVNKTTEVNNIS